MKHNDGSLGVLLMIAPEARDNVKLEDSIR
jgi:hypothetical protein